MQASVHLIVAEGEGHEGFPPPPEKDLESPSSITPAPYPGKAYHSPQLLAFSPGEEQAAGVWETCLAPGWPQLRSGKGKE